MASWDVLCDHMAALMLVKHHPELDSHNITASFWDHPEDSSEGKPSQWAESPVLLAAVALPRRKNGQIWLRSDSWAVVSLAGWLAAWKKRDCEIAEQGKKNQDLLRCLLTAEERLNEQKEVAVLREVDALIFCALFC